MHFVAIIFLFSSGACWGNEITSNSTNSSAEPIINDSTVPIPITEINPTVAPVTTSSTTILPTTTTSEIIPTTASQAPKPHSTASPYIDRKFDGPSFIGGMILALGMMAIAFVALKFYKSRSEQNYHTL